MCIPTASVHNGDSYSTKDPQLKKNLQHKSIGPSPPLAQKPQVENDNWTLELDADKVTIIIVKERTSAKT